jgi:erythromycin esterase-like protein
MSSQAISTSPQRNVAERAACTSWMIQMRSKYVNENMASRCLHAGAALGGKPISAKAESLGKARCLLLGESAHTESVKSSLNLAIRSRAVDALPSGSGPAQMTTC